MEELTKETLRKFFEAMAKDPRYSSATSVVKNLGREADHRFNLGIDYTRHTRKD